MFDIIDTIKKLKKNTFAIINPLETKQLFENLYSIKDGDSNYFIYKKNNKVIAIDSGYKNSSTREMEIKKLPLELSEIDAIFLTHIDSDHAGCLYEESPVFDNTQIYLHENEKQHLNKNKQRVSLGFIKINHKLEVKRKITYFKTNKPFYIGDIKIQPVLTPGHTLGHTCFFIDDKYLFIGDSMIFKNGEGYRFFDLLGFNNQQNSQSLLKLKEFAIRNGCKYIITSHTGLTNDIEKAFKFYNKKLS
jgi:glyoxylase-like metal-dependent hydrolase (beta-lactamase superfamily II)